MKRNPSDLKKIEQFIDFSYSSFGNALQVYEKPYNPDSPMGYCYKYSGDSAIIYNVVCCPLGKEYTDYRIKMHEYGHIYLGHLDGIHEELDGKILWTIQNHRAELIEYVNKSCGIDFADKLLNRIIDDPQLNHSLHNIAMDMEVNSKILSTEDIEEIEKDVTDVFTEHSPELKGLSDLVMKTDDELDKDDSIPEETKKAVKEHREDIKKELSSAKIKLILPERYHYKDGRPFENEMTYSEYLISIIKNLDQFIKMLVNISKGGNGDTSEMTSDDVKQALNEMGGSSGSNGMNSLDNLMDQCGMSSGQGNKGDKYKGDRDRDSNGGQDQEGQYQDHRTDSRDEADQKRQDGTIKATSNGCGNTGGADSTIDPNENKDAIDVAIEEVIKNYKHKVFSRDYKKDQTYLYNRGINRTVIAPIYKIRSLVTENPKIVFLIDVSGSMNKDLVNRVINGISKKMKNLKKGLKYDIIAWSTQLCSHHKDLDPRKPTPSIRIGGGTRMARGIEFFKQNYSQDCILVLISDFEDYLDEWERVTESMSHYDLYAFNYGYSDCERKFKNLKVRNFKT